MQTKKLFPLNLPSNFHGQIKLKGKNDAYISKKANMNTNQYQNITLKLEGWKKPRKNQQIQQQNRTIMNTPAKISSDNPDYHKNTYKFHKKQFKLKNLDKSKVYNIFGQQKINRSTLNLYQNPFNTTTVLAQSYLLNKTPNQKKNIINDITAKIGAYHETNSYQNDHIRNSSLRLVNERKTTLKIGFDLYIDTNKIP